MASPTDPVATPGPTTVRTAWFISSPELFTELQTGAQLNRDASAAFAANLYPNNTLVPLADSTLAAASAPSPEHVFVGSYVGGTVVASAELSNPLDAGRDHWQPAGKAPLILAFALDTLSGTGGFARWESGTLVRGLSASPTALVEDQGLPHSFESPFWAGEHPRVLPAGVAPDPFTLPFDAALFADRANAQWLGFSYLHHALGQADVASIPLCGFAIRPAGYQPTAAELREATEYSGGRMARWFGFAKPTEP